MVISITDREGYLVSEDQRNSYDTINVSVNGVTLQALIPGRVLVFWHVLSSDLKQFLFFNPSPDDLRNNTTFL